MNRWARQNPYLLAAAVGAAALVLTAAVDAVTVGRAPVLVTGCAGLAAQVATLIWVWKTDVPALPVYRRWGVRVLWEPRDLWIGVYWNRKTNVGIEIECLDIYVCLVPCVPIRFTRETSALPFNPHPDREETPR